MARHRPRHRAPQLETPAADLQAFAQDLDEERLLQVFRRMPYARRSQLVQLIEALLG